MSNSQRAISSAKRRSDEALRHKPEPPADLWEQLDAHLRDLALYVTPKPPGAFTREEFQAKFNLTKAQANARLQKLQAQNKVDRLGTSGRGIYYMLKK